MRDSPAICGCSSASASTPATRTRRCAISWCSAMASSCCCGRPSGRTLLLWLTPVLVLVLGGWVLYGDPDDGRNQRQRGCSTDSPSGRLWIPSSIEDRARQVAISDSRPREPVLEGSAPSSADRLDRQPYQHFIFPTEHRNAQAPCCSHDEPNGFLRRDRHVE